MLKPDGELTRGGNYVTKAVEKVVITISGSSASRAIEVARDNICVLFSILHSLFVLARVHTRHHRAGRMTAGRSRHVCQTYTTFTARYISDQDHSMTKQKTCESEQIVPRCGFIILIINGRNGLSHDH